MLLKIIDKLMGTPALHGAVLSNNLDEVQRLIDSGSNVNCRDKRHNNASPLMAAALCGYTEIARLLIEYDCNLELKGANGETALLVAARRDHHELIRLLVNSGANINATDKMNWTALIWAASKGSVSTVKLLIKKETIVDARTKDYGGVTALMLAAANGHFGVVSELVNAGADVKIERSDGLNALMIAKGNNQFEIEQVLEDASI